MEDYKGILCSIISIIVAVVTYNISHSFITAFLALCIVLGLSHLLIDFLESNNDSSSVQIRGKNTNSHVNPHGKATLQKTNILQSENGLCGDRAYFDNGVVYQYLERINKEIVIGKYNQDGIVYNEDGYEIAKIDTDPEYGLIHFNRLGDLQRLRESLFHKSDEKTLTEKEMEYYIPICKKCNIAWTCAESNHHGAIHDIKNSELIAQFLSSYEIPSIPSGAVHQKYLQSWEDDSYILGFGACFACLAYKNGKSTKYGSFYCSIGEYFEEP